MGQVLVFSLTAALNPTLVAATTVMLLLPSPKKLMLGYLLGAMMTSITLGLVIVFALKSSSLVHTAKHTVNPIVDLALGAIFLVISLVLKTDQDKRLKERRAGRKGPKQDKGPPRWQRAIGKGDARITFVVGALLTLPGASYLGRTGRHHQAQAGNGDYRPARPGGQRDPAVAARAAADRLRCRPGLDAGSG